MTAQSINGSKCTTATELMITIGLDLAFDHTLAVCTQLGKKNIFTCFSPILPLLLQLPITWSSSVQKITTLLPKPSLSTWKSIIKHTESNFLKAYSPSSGNRDSRLLSKWALYSVMLKSKTAENSRHESKYCSTNSFY